MKKIECYDISQRSDVFREYKGSPTLCARMGTGGNNIPIVLMDQGGDVMSIEHDKVGTLRAQTHGHEPIVLSENGTDRAVSVDKTPPLKTTTVPCFALAENTIGRQPENGGNGSGFSSEKSYTLNATGVHEVSFEGCVRRLTPVECERLMGFEDNYTQIPYRGKPVEKCPDAPRYKALGNSWAVPVVRWLGQRINEFLLRTGEKNEVALKR